MTNIVTYKSRAFNGDLSVFCGRFGALGGVVLFPFLMGVTSL